MNKGRCLLVFVEDWKLLRLEGDGCIAGRRHDSYHWFSAPGIGNAPLLTTIFNLPVLCLDMKPQELV